jgi:amphi-Trp domain-containing protein
LRVKSPLYGVVQRAAEQREAPVSDLELERKESLTRVEAAKRLSVFAEALASGNNVKLDLGGTSLTLRVADDVRTEFEVEIDGDEIEVEIELKWSTAGAERPGRSASADHSTASERASGKRRQDG